MEGKEPTAGLVHTFGDEVSRARGVCVLERIVILCIRHRTRIEPHIDEVQFALHGLAGRRNEDDAVYIRTMEVDDRRVVVRFAVVTYDMFGPGVGFHETGLDGLVNLGEEFCDRADTEFLLTVFGTPDRQRCSPVTGTR